MEDALVHLRSVEAYCQTKIVLILVLMEDALVLTRKRKKHLEKNVLILVLMEDALVQLLHLSMTQSSTSLNPCFNGRCTSTNVSVFDHDTIIKS